MTHNNTTFAEEPEFSDEILGNVEGFVDAFHDYLTGLYWEGYPEDLMMKNAELYAAEYHIFLSIYYKPLN